MKNGSSDNNDEKLINLTSSANRASIAFATDEWFATAENLLNPRPPTFVPDLFCPQGKVMDGWETRRRRTAGHDWCVIKLGGELTEEEEGSSGGSCAAPDQNACMLSHIELDTAYFTGNQAPRVSVEAMKVKRPPRRGCDSDVQAAGQDCVNDDYLYDWMPGAATRLARGEGGKGVRGTGQSPASVRRALDACRAVARRSVPNNQGGEWITVLPMTKLQPGYEESRYHHFQISEEVKSQINELGGVTHLKLNYYPDGGVARIKVYGYLRTPFVERKQSDGLDAESATHSSTLPLPTVHPHNSSDKPPPSAQPHPYPELSSEVYGGQGLACSNRHYGVPSNLLRPYLGKDMGDGWETARHPDRPARVAKDPVTGLQDTSLLDWCLLKLGCGGAAAGEGGGVSRIIVDTRHFKGNYPESVTVDGCYADPETVSDEAVGNDENGCIEWFPLLTRTSLAADAEHEFLREHGHIANGRRGVTHIRISITPDGGLSRVRVYGSPAYKVVMNVPLSNL